MLKEQLNSKTKTNIYRPDFLNQKGPIGDENEMVSQKYLKDQITELQQQFAEERKRWERKQKIANQQLTQQLMDMKLENDQLKSQLAETTRQLSQRNQDYTNLKQDHQDKLDQLQIQHNSEVDSLIRRIDQLQKEVDTIEAEKNKIIADLQQRLEKFAEQAQQSEERMGSLKIDLERVQREKDEQIVTNKQLLQNAERDRQQLSQMQQVKDDLVLQRIRADQFERQIEELKMAKQQLEQTIA